MLAIAAKADYPEIVAEEKALNAEAVFFAGYPDGSPDRPRRLKGSAGIAAPFLGSDPSQFRNSPKRRCGTAMFGGAYAIRAWRSGS